MIKKLFVGLLFVLFLSASIVDNAFACDAKAKPSSSSQSHARHSTQYEYEFSESAATENDATSSHAAETATFKIDYEADSHNDHGFRVEVGVSVRNAHNYAQVLAYERAVNELLSKNMHIAAKTQAVLDEVEQVATVLAACCNDSVDTKTLMALNDLTLKESPTLDDELQKAKYDIQQVIYDSSSYVVFNGSGKFRGIESSDQSNKITSIVREFGKKVAQWQADPVQAYYDCQISSVSRPYNAEWAQKIKSHPYNQDLRKLIALCEQKDFDQALELIQKYRSHHHKDDLVRDYSLLERVYVKEKAAHGRDMRKLELQKQVVKNAVESVEKLKNDANFCNFVQADNHRFTRRLHALQEASKHPELLTFKEYSLTQAGSSLLNKAGLGDAWAAALNGNALQQVIQAELVSLINSAGALLSQPSLSEELQDLTGTLATFAHVGNYCNRTGALDKAFVITDFCWSLLDCCLAAGEGALQGGANVGNALLDPVGTVKSLSEATLTAGYCLGNIIATVIAEDDLLERNPEEYERRWADRGAQIVAVADILHQKLAATPTRTIIKDMAAFATETWLTGKILQATGNFLHVAVNRSRMVSAGQPNAERIAYKAGLHGALPLEVAIAEEGAQNALITMGKNVVSCEEADHHAAQLQRYAGKHLEIHIKHPVVDGERVGSALKKKDAYHAFNDIIDNYARDAKTFNLVDKGTSRMPGLTKELYQIEGSLDGAEGVFEWIVENLPDGKLMITHRRFIKNGIVTGIPNVGGKP